MRVQIPKFKLRHMPFPQLSRAFRISFYFHFFCASFGKFSRNVFMCMASHLDVHGFTLCWKTDGWDHSGLGPTSVVLVCAGRLEIICQGRSSFPMRSMTWVLHVCIYSQAWWRPHPTPLNSVTWHLRVEVPAMAGGLRALQKGLAVKILDFGILDVNTKQTLDVSWCHLGMEYYRHGLIV